MVQSTSSGKSMTALTRRERRLRALERMLAHHRQLLERRRGQPVDVDAVIEEIRGEIG